MTYYSRAWNRTRHQNPGQRFSESERKRVGVTDVIVVGAGVVGAACAYHAARAGLGVTVLERRTVAGGTSGAGEGNVLVSDHPPGPELDLALLSVQIGRAHV